MVRESESITVQRSESITVQTWNVAASHADYQQALQVHYPKHKWVQPSKTKEEETQQRIEIENFRHNRFEAIFREISRTSSQPDILCLQEASKRSRVRQFCDWAGMQGTHDAVQEKEEKYEPDSAILWNPQRFEKVVNSEEVNVGHWTIVDLMEKETKRIVRVASAHISGFGLTEPDHIIRGDDFMEGSAATGDGELNGLLTRLDEKEGRADITVLGMDANVTYTHYPERLLLVEERGYKTCSGREKTAFNRDMKDKTAGLDHIFVRFDGELEKNLTIKRCVHRILSKIKLLDFNNPSDHIPVLRKITPKNSLDKIYDFFARLLFNCWTWLQSLRQSKLNKAKAS